MGNYIDFQHGTGAAEDISNARVWETILIFNSFIILPIFYFKPFLFAKLFFLNSYRIYFKMNISI